MQNLCGQEVAMASGMWYLGGHEAVPQPVATAGRSNSIMGGGVGVGVGGVGGRRAPAMRSAARCRSSLAILLQ